MMDTGITADQLSKYIDDKIPLLILDLRSKEKFMQGHITTANAVCTTPQQKQIIVSKLPPNQKIVLVDEDGNIAAENANMMARFGFDANYLKDGIKSWQKDLTKSKQEPVISGHDSWNKIKKDDDVFLLDVREPEEYSDFI